MGQTLRRAETAAAQSIERGATIENRPRQWRKKSPQKALRSLESSPVVHGVAQALESSLVQTSGAVKHRRPRHSKRKSPEHVLHSLESSPIVAQAPESSLAGSKPDPSNPSDTQGRPSFAWQAPLTQRSTTAAVPSAAAPQARAAHATAPSSAKQGATISDQAAPLKPRLAVPASKAAEGKANLEPFRPVLPAFEPSPDTLIVEQNVISTVTKTLRQLGHPTKTKRVKKKRITTQWMPPRVSKAVGSSKAAERPRTQTLLEVQDGAIFAQNHLPVDDQHTYNGMQHAKPPHPTEPGCVCPETEAACVCLSPKILDTEHWQAGTPVVVKNITLPSPARPVPVSGGSAINPADVEPLLPRPPKVSKPAIAARAAVGALPPSPPAVAPAAPAVAAVVVPPKLPPISVKVPPMAPAAPAKLPPINVNVALPASSPPQPPQAININLTLPTVPTPLPLPVPPIPPPPQTLNIRIPSPQVPPPVAVALVPPAMPLPPAKETGPTTVQVSNVTTENVQIKEVAHTLPNGTIIEQPVKEIVVVENITTITKSATSPQQPHLGSSFATSGAGVPSRPIWAQDMGAHIPPSQPFPTSVVFKKTQIFGINYSDKVLYFGHDGKLYNVIPANGVAKQTAYARQQWQIQDQHGNVYLSRPVDQDNMRFIITAGDQPMLPPAFHMAEPPLMGGFVTRNISDADVIKAVQHGVVLLNTDVGCTHSEWALKKVLSASSQVVAGTNYKLKLELQLLQPMPVPFVPPAVNKQHVVVQLPAPPSFTAPAPATVAAARRLLGVAAGGTVRITYVVDLVVFKSLPLPKAHYTLHMPKGTMKDLSSCK